MIDESAQIEKVYRQYFDLTIVNDKYDETYRQLRIALDKMGKEKQFVPANWVYWELRNRTVITTILLL